MVYYLILNSKTYKPLSHNVPVHPAAHSREHCPVTWLQVVLSLQCPIHW